MKIETKERDIEEGSENLNEEKYYHIDTLINKLFQLKHEIDGIQLKRNDCLTDLEKVKDRLKFLNRPGRTNTNLILVDAFHNETMDKYRSLLSRIKARRIYWDKVLIPNIVFVSTLGYMSFSEYFVVTSIR